MQAKQLYCDTLHELSTLRPDKGLVVYCGEDGSVNVGNGELFQSGGGQPSNFVGVYRTTSANETINLTGSVGFTQDVKVDYGDGSSVEVIASGNQISHEYANAEDHTVTIQFLARITDFSSAWLGCSALTSISELDLSNVTNVDSAWQQTGLTSFPALDFSSVTSMNSAWSDCFLFTSFPIISFPNVTSLQSCWNNCNSLVSFPMLDTSHVTNFEEAWAYCRGLTSFPLIDTSKGTNFSLTWRNCVGLTSFPALDFSSATNVYGAWLQSVNLVEFEQLDFSSINNGTLTFLSCSSLIQPPVTGTAVRNNATATAGTWVKPLLDAQLTVGQGTVGPDDAYGFGGFNYGPFGTLVPNGFPFNGFTYQILDFINIAPTFGQLNIAINTTGDSAFTETTTVVFEVGTFGLVTADSWVVEGTRRSHQSVNKPLIDYLVAENGNAVPFKVISITP